MAPRLIAGAGLLLAGFSVGWFARDGLRTIPKTASTSPPVVSVSLPDSFWTEMETQRAMLRQLHDTCEKKPVAAAPAAPVVSAIAVVAAPPAEDPTAIPEAQAIVDRAKATGKWTDDDAAAMRQTMADMTPAQRDEAMHILLQALNEQGLRSTTHGPKF